MPRRLAAVLAVSLVTALLVVGRPPAAVADEFTGSVDSTTAPVAQHALQVDEPSQVTGVLIWAGPAELSLRLLGPAGQLVAQAPAGPSSLLLFTPSAVPPGSYTLEVGAISGAADYRLVASAAAAPVDDGTGVVDSVTATLRTHRVVVAETGVLSALLTWETRTATPETSTAGAAETATVLSLTLRGGLGTVQGGEGGLEFTRYLQPGTYTLEVRAVSGAADYRLTTKVQTDLSSAQRIRAAQEAGDLTIDEAARYSLIAALDPEGLPAAYRSPAGASQPDGAGLDVLDWWDELTPATRAALAESVTVRQVPQEALGAPAKGSGDAIAVAGPPWVDCSSEWDWLVGDDRSDCQASVDVGGDGSPDFDVVFGVGPGAVPATDDEPPGGNGRPDVVDRVVDSTTKAWRVYEDLGFRPISDRITIVMQPGMAPGAGLALPSLFGLTGRVIFLDTDPGAVTAYLPRHELFHQVEYEYVGAADIALNFENTTWWMEANAEWGAHQANEAEGDAALRTSAYASSLPEALGEPEREWDRSRQLVGGPEYGSFIVAEYLDERFDGATTIEALWQAIDGGVGPQRPSDAIAALLDSEGDGFGAELVRYRQWSYVLSQDRAGSQYDIGFADADVEQYWRPSLERDARTAGEAGAAAARPARETATLVPDASARNGTVRLKDSGAAYVDLEVPQAAAQIRLFVQTPDAWVRASVLPFGDYPALCQAPIDVPLNVAWQEGGELVFDKPAGCTRLTLVLTDTTPPGRSSSSWSPVSWAAFARTGPVGETFVDELNDVERYGWEDGPVVYEQGLSIPRLDILSVDVSRTPDSLLVGVTLAAHKATGDLVSVTLRDDPVGGATFMYGSDAFPDDPSWGPCGSTALSRVGSLYLFDFDMACGAYPSGVLVQASTAQLTTPEPGQTLGDHAPGSRLEFGYLGPLLPPPPP